MKKNIILSLLLSLFAFAGFSQLELKPTVGMTAASFDSNPLFEMQGDSLVTKGKIGYQFGASLAIGRKLFVEPGVFYTMLSQKMDPAYTDSASFDYSAGFVRIPVNFGFQFIGSTASFAGLKIFIGPSIMIPTSVKENSYGILKQDVTSPQFDISVGAGLNVWLLFLDVSYGWGLTPQYADDPIEAKMKSLYVNMGFRFRLKAEE